VKWETDWCDDVANVDNVKPLFLKYDTEKRDAGVDAGASNAAVNDFLQYDDEKRDWRYSLCHLNIGHSDGGARVKLAVGENRKNISGQRDYGILAKDMAHSRHHLHLICMRIHSLSELFSFQVKLTRLQNHVLRVR
jgi:hypothetical protein